jgi:hypothetical protein
MNDDLMRSEDDNNIQFQEKLHLRIKTMDSNEF